METASHAFSKGEKNFSTVLNRMLKVPTVCSETYSIPEETEEEKQKILLILRFINYLTKLSIKFQNKLAQKYKVHHATIILQVYNHVDSLQLSTKDLPIITPASSI